MNGLLKKWNGSAWEEVRVAPAPHAHEYLSSGDTRSVNSIPSSYKRQLQAIGLKQNSVIGIPSTEGAYSSVLGYGGWTNSSGGVNHELGFGGTGGLYHRYGYDSWSAWSKLATESYVQSKLSNVDLTPYLKHNGGTPMSGDLNMNAKRIVNVADPTSNSHAANKGYVDNKVSSGSIIQVTTATPAATTVKEVTLSGHTPVAGNIYAVKFTNGNTKASPTLNINSTGAKPIKLNGQNPTAGSGSGAAYVATGGTMMVIYDGTNFNMFGSGDITDANTNTTYTAGTGITISGNVISVVDDYVRKDGIATVATSGNYNDLSNKPVIPSIPSVMTTTEGNTGTATTQRTINAANLKSIILNHSPAGSRPASSVNLSAISVDTINGATHGNAILRQLSGGQVAIGSNARQLRLAGNTDRPYYTKLDPVSNLGSELALISDLNNKQNKLVAGNNITIDATTNTISATGGGGSSKTKTFSSYSEFKRYVDSLTTKPEGLLEFINIGTSTYDVTFGNQGGMPAYTFKIPLSSVKGFYIRSESGKWQLRTAILTSNPESGLVWDGYGFPTAANSPSLVNNSLIVRFSEFDYVE